MSPLSHNIGDKALWTYGNLMSLEMNFRDKARELLHMRLPSYPLAHCVKLLGGSPHEFSSRFVCDADNELIGIIAFSIGDLSTVEIVAFVSLVDGRGIGRFLMEHFVSEMQSKDKSAVLTYVEPAAVPFFSRLGFSRQIPARSLYERVVSKYVKANMMYLDLLSAEDPPRHVVSLGDRLMVLVDGTMIPRQCIVKAIEKGKILIHYFFWNSKHDEWIFPHSPRIRWDIATPAELPTRKGGAQLITGEQVKQIWEKELLKEKKLEDINAARIWPKGIRKKGPVEVKFEGVWIRATVVEKTDFFCYCEFEHLGQNWLQDFPRESVRIMDSSESVLDTLLKKKTIVKKMLVEKKPAKIIKKKKVKTIALEISPDPKPAVSHRRERSARGRSLSDDFNVSDPTSSCSVCLNNDRKIISCGNCQVSVHPECYFLNDLPKSSWVCDTCKESFLRGSKKYNPACTICHRKRFDSASIMTQSLDYKSVHVACALEKNLAWVPTERRFATYRP